MYMYMYTILLVHVYIHMYIYVHTVYGVVCSELEAVGRGVGVTTSEAVMSDIYTQFRAAVQVFSSSSQV